MLVLTLFECCLVDFILFSLDEMKIVNKDSMTEPKFFFVFSSEGGYDKCYLHNLSKEERITINNTGLLYSFSERY